MKQRNHLESLRQRAARPAVVIALLLTCFTFSPQTQAVVPPPDGGYPGFNTAEGQNALLSLTTGTANTAVGWFSLKNITTGSFNTGLGAGTLVLNTGDENTAVGTAALLLNTASGNTAVGSRALLNNTTGGVLGNNQGFDLGPNVAVGLEALHSNTIGSANTAVGYQALRSFTAGPAGFEPIGLSTAVGFQALANATEGIGNSAFGYQALVNNTDGAANTAVGLQALSANTSGNNNTANGGSALSSNTEGDFNTANGNAAMSGNISGSYNTACGVNALMGNISGNLNTAVGMNALTNNTSGGNITVLGAAAGSNIMTASNVIAIGHAGANVDNSCYIGQIFGATSGGTAVLIGADGRLGTITSSRRFKEDIKPTGSDSEALFSLKPVRFHYKRDIDPIGRSQFGLIAEEVEQVNPDLVVHDKEGKPYTVRYEQVNAMLLNEFLKEHRKVEKLEATLEAVSARLEEQADQIQKVTAQVEATKSLPQLVLNNP